MYQRFAAVYDQLMRETDYDAWADAAKALLGPAPLSILECGCGTGEMTLRLYDRGYELIGADISPDMLDVAGKKARKHGADIPFVHMDMRNLSVHRPVDAVVCFCDGVNYLASYKELLAFFRSGYGVLKSNGAILFDVSSGYKLEHVLSCNTFAEEEGDCAYIWKNNFDPESRLLALALTVFVRDGESYTRFTEEQLQRAHSHCEILSALTEAGFGNIRAFDGYSLRPAGEKSERVVYFARRNDGEQSY